MTQPARFTQSDITRILKAAKAADVRVRVTIELDGHLNVSMLSGDDSAGGDRSNPCDRVFQRGWLEAGGEGVRAK